MDALFTTTIHPFIAVFYKATCIVPNPYLNLFITAG